MVGQPCWSATTVSFGRVLPSGQHGADEVLAGGGIDPGGAQDDRLGAGCEDGLLAGQFAGAVDALRRDRVGLDIGFGLGAVEHVVGRDMDQRDVGRGAQPRQDGWAVAVGAVGGIGIGLGGIHRGIGGGVDHQAWSDGAESRLDRLRVVEIEVRPADATSGRRRAGKWPPRDEFGPASACCLVVTKRPVLCQGMATAIGEVPRRHSAAGQT